MSPDQQQFFKFVLDSLKNNNIWLVLLVLAIFNFPTIVALIFQIWAQISTDRLWKDRCADKDREIERLAENNKQLQNALLKTKR